MNIHQKKLKYINRDITLVNHRHAGQIRHMVAAGLLTLFKSEYVINAAFPPKDFNNPESTCTYTDCIFVNLKPDETIRLEVWHDKSYSGNPDYVESAYTFKGNWWEYQPLVDQLDASFRNQTMLELTNKENQEREQRRIAMADLILENML